MESPKGKGGRNTNEKPVLQDLFIVSSEPLTLESSDTNLPSSPPDLNELTQNENEKGSHILIRDIESIEWFKESNLGEFCFKLELKSSKINEYVFICETKQDLAGWVIALDALVSNSVSNSFNTFVKPLSDKKLILKMIYKDDYKGGIIKSSYDEEWQYEPNGTTTLLSAPDAPKGKVVYEWDGEMFTPKSDSLSFGAGQWSGVFVGWYLDEWEPFKTSTKRDKFLKYFYDADSKEYIPESPGITAWKWTRHFLASKSNEGEWIVEGNIPEPVVIFLQLMRYSRTGIKGNPEVERKVPESILMHLPKPPTGTPPELPKLPTEVKKPSTPPTTLNIAVTEKPEEKQTTTKTNTTTPKKDNHGGNWVPKVGGIVALATIAVVFYLEAKKK